MIVAEGTFNVNDEWGNWAYIDGHTSDEASGKLTYMKLLSKSNGNIMVVPSSIYILDGSVKTVGRQGYFWSSSLSSKDVSSAWSGNFNQDGYGVDSASWRFMGLSVRGVVGQ